MFAAHFGKSFTVALASGTSASSTASPISPGVTHARLVASQGCWVTVTPATVGAVANAKSSGAYLAAGVAPEVIRVSPGDIFNVILDGTTAGVFNVTEMSL